MVRWLPPVVITEVLESAAEISKMPVSSKSPAVPLLLQADSMVLVSAVAVPAAMPILRFPAELLLPLAVLTRGSGRMRLAVLVSAVVVQMAIPLLLLLATQLSKKQLAATDALV